MRIRNQPWILIRGAVIYAQATYYTYGKRKGVCTLYVRKKGDRLEFPVYFQSPPPFSPSIKLSQVGLATLDNCRRRCVQNFSPTARTPNSPYFSDEKDSTSCCSFPLRLFLLIKSPPQNLWGSTVCSLAPFSWMGLLTTQNDGGEERGGGRKSPPLCCPTPVLPNWRPTHRGYKNIQISEKGGNWERRTDRARKKAFESFWIFENGGSPKKVFSYVVFSEVFFPALPDNARFDRTSDDSICW